MRDLATLQQELADARQEVRNLQVMGLRPDLSPQKAEFIRNLERSARAEVKLRHMALAYQRQQQSQQGPQSLPPDQTNVSVDPNLPASTKPETYASTTSIPPKM